MRLIDRNSLVGGNKTASEMACDCKDRVLCPDIKIPKTSQDSDNNSSCIWYHMGFIHNARNNGFNPQSKSYDPNVIAVYFSRFDTFCNAFSVGHIPSLSNLIRFTGDTHRSMGNHAEQ